MTRTGDVCVIGGGPSGIAAAKALRDRGIAFDGYERRSDFGGNWLARAPDSPAFEGLVMNTSAARSSFSDIAIDVASGRFATHQEMLRYLTHYARGHGLGASFEFGMPVDAISAAGDRWRLRLGDGRETTYRHVVVATGVHAAPRLPAELNRFDGRLLHSSEYRRAADHENRRVLIVGFGTSAAEIAADLAPTAREVLVSVRRPMHLFPKTVAGLPVDWLDSPTGALLPWPLRRALLRGVQRLRVGSLERLGVVPDHGLFQEQPTISDGFIVAVRRGRVRVISAVEEATETGVRLVDGAVVDVDTIIAATGYVPGLNFLPRAPFASGAPLYRGIVEPELVNHYFVGLVEPLGGLCPIVEAQARWTAAAIDGALRLPDPHAMRALVGLEDRTLRAQFGGERRHVLLRERQSYLRALRRDLLRSQARNVAEVAG